MLGCGLDLVSPNVMQQTSVLCKYLYLIHAPRHCLKPGRTCDYISQLSTQLGALHCHIVNLYSLQTFPSLVSALSDFVTSTSDYLAPSLEHNNLSCLIVLPLLLPLPTSST